MKETFQINYYIDSKNRKLLKEKLYILYGQIEFLDELSKQIKIIVQRSVKKKKQIRVFSRKNSPKL